ncbi:hypothetical protein Tco_1111546 [Tanacetum coccineum]|uniref:Uncharacterized protein n=1 Tax=Tanacetum coccineum TaxID=301880 RepID=A0ABQ5IM07_9ASTR
MLRAFLVSLTGAASRWLRNQPSGLITTGEALKTKFLNNTVHLLVPQRKWRKATTSSRNPMKAFSIHGKDFLRIADKGAIPFKTDADAKVAIQEMAEFSQKWHNGTSSKTRSTKTSDGLVGCEVCKGPYYTKDCPLKGCCAVNLSRGGDGGGVVCGDHGGCVVGFVVMVLVFGGGGVCVVVYIVSWYGWKGVYRSLGE